MVHTCDRIQARGGVLGFRHARAPMRSGSMTGFAVECYKESTCRVPLCEHYAKGTNVTAHATLSSTAYPDLGTLEHLCDLVASLGLPSSALQRAHKARCLPGSTAHRHGAFQAVQHMTHLSTIEHLRDLVASLGLPSSALGRALGMCPTPCRTAHDTFEHQRAPLRSGTMTGFAVECSPCSNPYPCSPHSTTQRAQCSPCRTAHDTFGHHRAPLRSGTLIDFGGGALKCSIESTTYQCSPHSTTQQAQCPTRSTAHDTYEHQRAPLRSGTMTRLRGGALVPSGALVPWCSRALLPVCPKGIKCDSPRQAAMCLGAQVLKWDKVPVCPNAVLCYWLVNVTRNKCDMAPGPDMAIGADGEIDGMSHLNISTKSADSAIGRNRRIGVYGGSAFPQIVGFWVIFDDNVCTEFYIKISKLFFHQKESAHV